MEKPLQQQKSQLKQKKHALTEQSSDSAKKCPFKNWVTVLKILGSAELVYMPKENRERHHTQKHEVSVLFRLLNQIFCSCIF